MAVLDFDMLQDILAQWPRLAVPAEAEDGVFHRLQQVLAVARDTGAAPGGPDFMALVRHVLRRRSLAAGQAAILRLPTSDGWPTRQQWGDFGVRAHSEANGQRLVEATPWSPAWLEDSDTPVFEDAFAEPNVRLDWQRPIDPFLGEAIHFDTYVSPGQREAVRSALLLPPGETLIVALPTGSGKSLVAQASVLTAGIEGRLTVCIVPTTSLALDQARQMRDLLKRRHPNRDLPTLAWHAGLGSEARDAVKAAVREGRQGILYCSPEAATGALLPALYDCARAGFLTSLVIDEAHLVSQWGDGFRPAFQMLGGVRRGLLGACPRDPFKTILMSATITPDTVDTIEALFGPARVVRMIASLHLRPEPQYWLHREDDEAEKVRKVLEVLRHAPRPFILYVTERADARRWLATLRAHGYRRLACFHGETPNAERLEVIDDWSKNKLDGVVATSAFGVGIDKRDVRTVIHAAVPETLDRFYQEVGRGGRDGRPSASFLLYSQRDRDVADKIAAPSLIGEELAFDRWASMHAEADHLDALGRHLRVDLTVVPPHLMQESDYNEAWNMRTLVMMARAKMLELESEAPERVEQLEDEAESAFELRSEAHWSKYFRHAIVRMTVGGHKDRDTFERMIAAERRAAFNAASVATTMLDDFLEGRAEISGLLDRLYRNHAPGRSVIVSRACGGCPQHRALGRAETAYVEPPAYGIERVVPTDLTPWWNCFRHLKPGAPVILTLPQFDASLAVAVAEDLVALFGVREIGVRRDFRSANPALATIHRKAETGIVLIQDLEEDEHRPSSYELPRASIWEGRGSQNLPTFLFTLNRPLHVIVAAAATRDPWRPDRRLSDTGSNHLTYEQFRQGVRQ